ncbi:MAG TPA: DUF6455 family protein [Burkholderiales bacterium]|jgi:hypothetical protein
MSPTFLDIGAAVVLLAVVGALFAWFARNFGVTSDRRMMRMLVRAGVDPAIVAQGEKQAIIEDIRRRCRKCQAEDLCERWLAEKVAGDNGFCPNARILNALTTGHPAVA